MKLLFKNVLRASLPVISLMVVCLMSCSDKLVTPAEKSIDATSSASPAYPFYRYWSPGGADHFYSTVYYVDGEIADYVRECTEGYVFKTDQGSDTYPLYRWWNSTIADHFYTTTYYSSITGYVYEGIAGYVYLQDQGSSTVPLYRWWSPGHDHFYTTTYYSSLTGYTYEGIQCYVKTGMW